MVGFVNNISPLQALVRAFLGHSLTDFTQWLSKFDDSSTYVFFSKKPDQLVVTSKTPHKECFVRSFASNARTLGVQRL